MYGAILLYCFRPEIGDNSRKGVIVSAHYTLKGKDERGNMVKSKEEGPPEQDYETTTMYGLYFMLFL